MLTRSFSHAKALMSPRHPSAASKQATAPRLEPEALPPGVPARLAAVHLLERVLKHGRTFEDALSEVPMLNALAGPDAAFARLLALTALRHHGQAQSVLGSLLTKPLPGRAAALAGLIEIGIVQLLWLEVAPHAAVDTTVETARAMGLNAYCGLANAILQTISRDLAGWKGKAEASLGENLPAWMLARLRHRYGERTLHEILAAQAGYGSFTPPVVDLSLHRNIERPEDVILLPNGSWRVTDGGRVEQWPGYIEGDWWVQDMAATLPAALINAAFPSPARVLDACAAPGGKTAQLASAGHRIVALDRSGPRLRRLNENMRRLQLTVEVIEADATTHVPAELYDAVLLDAPCSATGTIRRHPELPWQRRPEDMTRLIGLQRAMLRQAAQWVRPGGLLVYAVCTLLPEEGEEAIADLLADDAGWRVEPVVEATKLGFPEALHTPEGGLRTLPSHAAALGGMDGFYIARLRRVG